MDELLEDGKVGAQALGVELGLHRHGHTAMVPGRLFRPASGPSATRLSPLGTNRRLCGPRRGPACPAQGAEEDLNVDEACSFVQVSRQQRELGIGLDPEAGVGERIPRFQQEVA
ncbi:MAG: hypothetical protein H0T39_13265 [Actinobacteria bacterium]|nr:hypothetical protein [Actinomycetota bacterium]